MGQLTNAIGDDDIVKHFREVLAPYVVETQLSPGLDSNISPTSVQRMMGGGRGVLNTRQAKILWTTSATFWKEHCEDSRKSRFLSSLKMVMVSNELTSVS